jgi:TLC domain
MISVFCHLPTFLISLSWFLSWRFLCYDFMRDESKAKLVWQFPCHIICTLFGWWNFSDLILNPNMVEDDRNGFKCYGDTLFGYAFYCAYWTVVFIDFMLQKHKDLDHKLMKRHHIATFFALFTSDLFGFRRFGINVLFLHDISDIFIMLLKLVHKFRFNETLVSIVYVICMMFWIWARICMFSIYICFYIIVPEIQIRLQRGQHIIYATPYIFLLCLVACNCYWTYILLSLSCKKSSEVVKSYENN